MKSHLKFFGKATDLLSNKSVIHIGHESMISGTVSRGKILTGVGSSPLWASPGHTGHQLKLKQPLRRGLDHLNDLNLYGTFKIYTTMHIIIHN